MLIGERRELAVKHSRDFDEYGRSRNITSLHKGTTGGEPGELPPSSSPCLPQPLLAFSPCLVLKLIFAVLEDRVLIFPPSSEL